MLLSPPIDNETAYLLTQYTCRRTHSQVVDSQRSRVDESPSNIVGSHKPEVITEHRVMWNQDRSGMELGLKWYGTKTEVVWNQDRSGMELRQKWYGTRREVVWNQDRCGLEQGQTWFGTRTEEEEVTWS